MKEIAKGVYHISIPSRTLALQANNTYFLIDKRQGVVIDPALAIQDPQPIQQCLVELEGKEIIGIIITHAHPDHYEGINLLPLGVKLMTHPLEWGRIKDEFKRERELLELKDGDKIDVCGKKLRIFHLPGHSPGHICIYLEEEKILFSGDLILGWGTVLIAPPAGGDMIQYMQSLERLLELEISLILPGHGPMVDTPRQKIEQYIRHRGMRESMVYSTLLKGFDTPQKIVQQIYKEEELKVQGRDMTLLAEMTVLAHLIKLEKEGKVVKVGEEDSHSVQSVWKAHK